MIWSNAYCYEIWEYWLGCELYTLLLPSYRIIYNVIYVGKIIEEPIDTSWPRGVPKIDMSFTKP